MTSPICGMPAAGAVYFERNTRTRAFCSFALASSCGMLARYDARVAWKLAMSFYSCSVRLPLRVEAVDLDDLLFLAAHRTDAHASVDSDGERLGGVLGDTRLGFLRSAQVHTALRPG